jgi:hypothetical protein
MYSTDRRRPLGALLDVAFDRNSIGVVVQPLESCEHEDLEFAEKISFGHGYYLQTRGYMRKRGIVSPAHWAGRLIAMSTLPLARC